MDEERRQIDQMGSARISRRRFLVVTGSLAGLAAVGQLATGQAEARPKPRRRDRGWIAGDHHVHSEYSVGWDYSKNPPEPIIAGDAIYPISKNAQMARNYGLLWMVSTDHGGPNHSKLNRDQAYPSLLESRKAVPQVIQFYGMEFDTPAADHSSLIIPKTRNERDVLYEIESRYSKRDAWPTDPSRDTEEKMIEALEYMKELDMPPVLFANHPARSASGLGVYGLDTPREFRNWNDTAPNVSVGFEGAPGHQAAAINPDGTIDPNGARGGYGRYPTMGGFDQMTARLGGLWDSLLGEGRRWWITSTSDSHVHYRDGGADFWPGEYSKTYVNAARDYGDVLDGLRNGRVFVTTGDLIDRLDFTARSRGRAPRHAEARGNTASVGETLTLRGKGNRDVNVEIRFRVPQSANPNGDRPRVGRVDLILGEITGPAASRDQDTNPTTRVVERFGSSDWKREGDYATISYTLKNVQRDSYIRVRGTNTDELEPQPDPRGEDPWSDLWFYSNPIFISMR